MKKITAFLLVLVLIAGLLPAAAFAWDPDEIMEQLPSNVEEPKESSWLSQKRTMYVASKYGKLIYIMRAPRSNSKRLGDALEGEAVSVYAIQNGYALAIVDRTRKGGWLDMDRLVDDYNGEGQADTLDINNTAGSGKNVSAELPVDSWTDIVKLYPCNFALLGLSSDGTVLIDRDAVLDNSDDYVMTFREHFDDFYDDSLYSIDKAVEQMLEWKDVREIFTINYYPVAVTNTGKALIPDILYNHPADDENVKEWKAALDGVKSIKNIDRIYYQYYCIFVIEDGGKVHSFPVRTETWEEMQNNGEEEFLDPARVFTKNEYTDIVTYSDSFLGIRKSDGRVVTAGSMYPSVIKTISKWKNIRQLYLFSTSMDYDIGLAEIVFGVDKNGKISVAYASGDDSLYSDMEAEFAELIAKDAKSWNNLKTIKTWAVWDMGFAQIVAVMNNGDAKVYNGYTYEYENYSSIGEITKVKNIKDVLLLGSRVLLLDNNGKLSLIKHDDDYYEGEVKASCSKKLVAFSDGVHSYGIAEDGTVGYIKYSYQGK